MTAKYIIGIDLGTTNSVLAYTPVQAESNAGSSEAAEIQLLPIPQLVAAGTVEERDSLPSFVYLANAAERTAGGLDAPWGKDQSYAVGQFARDRGGEAPDRTVGAAKSWLCHTGVDRRQPILPWQAPNDVEKISPVTASQRYLQHLVQAWQQRFPDAPIEQQQVVLTVPASFDPVARELTREAAIAAGLPANFVLLEEPQAAFYAWLSAVGDQWRKMLSVGQRVLVCDVGGGTTDLTLITVDEDGGDLTLRREAVGDHLLVGGDNMDLTMAHVVAGEFAKKKTKLNPWQSVSLWHSCRAAKESLLAPEGSEKQTISVLGRGSKLIGGTVSVEVDRESISQLLVDGFLPKCGLDAVPQRQAASGFQEIGLPFESDPGITRHLASFVSNHCTASESDSVSLPDFVLFNGGVFKADGFRNRMLEIVNSWSADAGDSKVQPLQGVHDLDHAVARGACYYGLNKQRGGLRIRGGTARSYYVGIETAGLAIPGAPRPLKALCVVPFGMEEGTETDVPSGEIGLVVGKPARFRFFSSNVRTDDKPGEQLDWWDDTELTETDPMEATLTLADGATESHVPVKFHANITELGVLELWCVAVHGDGRWKLEFNVRDEPQE
ncbi:Chaperone protein DnaK [Rosistilla carotiformis]|uniref:Chaperone protein DnaK n=1 Tax=Rosistilla carotiformis TaxID=2528017 RepID=A0A518JSJ8_9BACT|nr:Hsp70 family protein [Rosistilla carotiformis]QDV68521.1 Chaperone protein DnaK [Rosistilla carotiformis]